MRNRAIFDLRIWREASDLSRRIYELSANFPIDERFGLTSQLRRSANSVSATIAEGTGRNTTKDFINFLYMARGSVHEVVSHLSLCVDLRYVRADDGRQLIERYQGLAAGIFACITALKQKK